ncbi:histone H1 [Elizabethkingia bruuniana]|uniref:Histone H1 n=2 Tax=Elizabethkingia TaxID=308865 RepID=A0A7T7V3G8_9FLAO|nr:histone H1 [Elizabethkingia bruuniana]MCT3940419.1 histone H1 [Elizabethkingia anophelis]MCT4193665.1 histone H1 [Elizabethkingia anophelis]MDV3662774.1 histone H1 [Elizabethkingia anophelis]QQN61192.1 histone H1 [Elizabethkingia bruuniana]
MHFLEELLEKINAEFEVFKTDSNLQLEKGNKAAGTRARKAALELAKILKDFRKISVEESKK